LILRLVDLEAEIQTLRRRSKMTSDDEQEEGADEQEQSGDSGEEENGDKEDQSSDTGEGAQEAKTENTSDGTEDELAQPDIQSPDASSVSSDTGTVTSGDEPSTANVPISADPNAEPESGGETETIMAPTWPVQVPVQVPVGTEEPPENPHAGENEGAQDGLGTQDPRDAPEAP
jgi:hypothetical protein